MKDSLGDRIKKYEAVSNPKLTPRSCVFIRVDGKAFHSWTKRKNCTKPFDSRLTHAMVRAAATTARQMAGFKMAYQQSDECTFMLTDFDNPDTQGWFDYKLNKLVSITASMYTAYFNQAYSPFTHGLEMALFDARAFVVPRDDAPNVFVWRSADWYRNSLSMLAQAHFSHKELQHKNAQNMHDMLHEKGINWATDLTDQQKNGTWITRYGDAGLVRSHDRKTYQDIDNYLQHEMGY